MIDHLGQKREHLPYIMQWMLNIQVFFLLKLLRIDVPQPVHMV